MKAFLIVIFLSFETYSLVKWCLSDLYRQLKNFQKYLNQSQYKPFNVRTHQGHYRQLTLRSNEEKDLLAIVIFDKHELTEVRSSF